MPQPSAARCPVQPAEPSFPPFLPFLPQVQSMMGDGMLTPARAAALDSLRGQMGLSKEAADKIIKGFQNRKLINEMQVRRATPAPRGTYPVYSPPCLAASHSRRCMCCAVH